MYSIYILRVYTEVKSLYFLVVFYLTKKNLSLSRAHERKKYHSCLPTHIKV